MEYNFRAIEQKWQEYWRAGQTYKVENGGTKPKHYVLDMFPYPSGAGLHVGHPLGYIASDIVARYKRLKGFNVLHPMGYDAFGLPAEQYAIQTGRHPAETTKENIVRYREQLDKMGFSFDWSREVQTCDPEYYKWTQWIFLQLFKSWYNCKTQKAEPIETLIAVFEKDGYKGEEHRFLTGEVEQDLRAFSAADWKSFSEKQKSDILLHFRLAYLGEAWVNWCPALGTVLANDEVKDGVSERGGYPVERKRMPQWSLRITSYAERLLRDLDALDWPDSIKEAQRNWIGRSEGTSIRFKLEEHDAHVEVFTTRPDTVFGVSFVTLAPEHELVEKITTPEFRPDVEKYVSVAKNKSERERQADVKTVSGQFTGAYVLHPFTAKRIPVWIGEYVLAGYGTGAVMAVPGHDSRDHAFAKHFGLPILKVIDPPASMNVPPVEAASFDEKAGTCVNSDFLNGLEVSQAIPKAIGEIEKRGYGKGKINFRLRDAAFGRQRYWGEPIPVYYKDGIPTPLDESELPLVLPEIDKFLPTETGEPPLARAKGWFYEPHPRPLSFGEGGGGVLTFGENDVPRFFTTSPEKWINLKKWCRENRKKATLAESNLWNALRNKGAGFKIRRQHAIDCFIVDFVCLEKKVVIEVDGDYHDTPEQQEYDRQRTAVLNELGFKVVRFRNERVLEEIDKVFNEIKALLATTVLPLGEERGGVAPRYPYETTTMPGWAGSSWYFLRYMDPHNENEFASKAAVEYWRNVDLYIGGAEHATGHLLYVRFWTKFLFDIGKIPVIEPAQKLINQGMIQGVSALAYWLVFNLASDDVLQPDEIDFRDKVIGEYSVFISKNLYEEWLAARMRYTEEEKILNKPPFKNALNNLKQIVEERFMKERGKKISIKFNPDSALQMHVNVKYVTANKLNVSALQQEPGFEKSIFIKDDSGEFICDDAVEKMSKRWHNVVNPDDICNQYGADTLRLYEMFLGPLEQHKPWNTNGITGVHNFLRRFWRLFHDAQNNFSVSEEAPSKAELKVLHKTIKKIGEDIERFGFNTAVSSFMIACNELTDLKSNKRAILEPLLIALSPFAPHISEELWEKSGHKESITKASFPAYDEQYLSEDSFEYPVQINGKLRFKHTVALGLSAQEIEKEVMGSAEIQKWLEGKAPKKIIVVPNKIVNIVV